MGCKPANPTKHPQNTSSGESSSIISIDDPISTLLVELRDSNNSISLPYCRVRALDFKSSTRIGAAGAIGYDTDFQG
jgi:hypothetical protein